MPAALNTQVVTQTIVPLPIVNAEAALKEAGTLAEKKDRIPEESARLKASLADARAQLERAEALGYGKKSEFVAFYQQLRDIDQKTADDKSGTGIFAKIEASIADFLKSIQPGKS